MTLTEIMAWTSAGGWVKIRDKQGRWHAYPPEKVRAMTFGCIVDKVNRGWIEKAAGKENGR